MKFGKLLIKNLTPGAIPAFGRLSSSLHFGGRHRVSRRFVAGVAALATSLSLGSLEAAATHGRPGEIAIPINIAVDVANAMLNKIEVQLDGTDGGGKTESKGSWVKIGSQKTAFTLDGYTIDRPGKGEMRYHINDIRSEIVHVKYLGEGVSRLTVLFESGGREISRYCHRCAGKDDRSDWDLNGLRVDIEFSLVNQKTASGKASVSYLVKRVKMGADLDLPLLGEGLEDWILKKAAGRIEGEMEKQLNAFRDEAATALFDKLRKSTAFLQELEKRGLPVNTQVAGISVRGNKVVFRFD